MSVTEQSVPSEPTASSSDDTRPLANPLTLIADGAFCTLDGHCTSA